MNPLDTEAAETTRYGGSSPLDEVEDIFNNMELLLTVKPFVDKVGVSRPLIIVRKILWVN